MLRPATESAEGAMEAQIEHEAEAEPEPVQEPEPEPGAEPAAAENADALVTRMLEMIDREEKGLEPIDLDGPDDDAGQQPGSSRWGAYSDDEDGGGASIGDSHAAGAGAGAGAGADSDDEGACLMPTASARGFGMESVDRPLPSLRKRFSARDKAWARYYGSHLATLLFLAVVHVAASKREDAWLPASAVPRCSGLLVTATVFAIASACVWQALFFVQYATAVGGATGRRAAAVSAGISEVVSRVGERLQRVPALAQASRLGLCGVNPQMWFIGGSQLWAAAGMGVFAVTLLLLNATRSGRTVVAAPAPAPAPAAVVGVAVGGNGTVAAAAAAATTAAAPAAAGGATLHENHSTLAVLAAWGGLLLIARDAIFVQLRVRGRAAFVGVMLELVTSVLQKHQATVLVVFAVAAVQGVFFMLWGTALMHALGAHAATLLHALVLPFVLFSFYWTTQLLHSIVSVVVSGTVYVWYHESDTDATGRSVPALHFLQCALSSSLGSVCLAALMVTPARATWLLLRVARSQSIVAALGLSSSAAERIGGGGGGGAAERELYGSGGTRVCGGLCRAGVHPAVGRHLLAADAPLATFVRSYHPLAVLQVAGYGASFAVSARESWKLFVEGGLEAVLEDDLTGTILGFSADGVGGATGAIFGSLAAHELGADGGGSCWLLFVLVFFAIGYCTASVLTAMQSAAVRTLFLCFAERPDRLIESHPIIYQRLSRLAEVRNFRVEGLRRDAAHGFA